MKGRRKERKKNQDEEGIKMLRAGMEKEPGPQCASAYGGGSHYGQSRGAHGWANLRWQQAPGTHHGIVVAVDHEWSSAPQIHVFFPPVTHLWGQGVTEVSPVAPWVSPTLAAFWGDQDGTLGLRDMKFMSFPLVISITSPQKTPSQMGYDLPAIGASQKKPPLHSTVGWPMGPNMICPSGGPRNVPQRRGSSWLHPVPAPNLSCVKGTCIVGGSQELEIPHEDV